VSAASDLIEAAIETALEGRPSGAALIGCSGGLDSTVLARVLAPRLSARGDAVWIVHLDHATRGHQSAADAASVSALARALGVPLLRRTRRPGAGLRNDLGPQAAARAVRHAWFAEARRLVGASTCFLAHHEDDQVETLRIQQRRHRRPDAVVGIPIDRPGLSRPLLGVPRAALRALAEERGWEWREDPSNRDGRFVRTAVRAEPALSPSMRSGLLREALNSRDRRTYVHRAAQRAGRSVVRASGVGWVEMDPDPLNELPEEVALALLQRHVQSTDRRPPSVAALRGVLRCSRGLSGGVTRSVHLGSGWTASLRPGELTLRRGGARAALPPEVGAARLPAGAGRALMPHLAESSCVVFDAAVTDGGVRAGRVGVGRRMRPFGDGGSRLLRDLLAEAGVPEEARGDWPVIEATGGEVLWLPGVRRSAHHPLTGASRGALVLYTVASRADGHDDREWSL
jgi:tRNA(Ile)-lysidine synthase